MMRRALSKGFEARYILADSWFFSTEMIEFAISKSLDFLGRPKFNNWKYRHDGKGIILGNLVKKLIRKKSKKWSPRLQMYTMETTVEFKNAAMKVFFYKDKKRGSKWHVLMCTNKSIGVVQAFKIYQNRWAIEVSYKELKQHLGFGKCQSTDFDAQISDVTLSLIAYNLLSYTKAKNDYQTIGQLFSEISQNWIKPNLLERFWNEFYSAICILAEMVEKDIQDLLDCVLRESANMAKWNRILTKLTTET